MSKYKGAAGQLLVNY